MPKPTLTNEFSICLLADDRTTRSIESLRQAMPVSPYRDDPPHMTLLRGIQSPSAMSDQQLTSELVHLLQPPTGLKAAAKKTANFSNHLYSSSSVVLLSPSREMKAFRKKVIKVLKRHGYRIEKLESLIFLPHITIRLGVSIGGLSRASADELFPKKQEIIFTKWVVFRLLKDGQARLIHEINLQA